MKKFELGQVSEASFLVRQIVLSPAVWAEAIATMARLKEKGWEY